MKLTEQLEIYQKEKRALLATNFYNLETMQGIMQAAAEVKTPIILQLTQSTIEYIGLEIAVTMAREAAEFHGIRAWIHLDHALSIELVKKCLDAGFDSVMIDASEKPFEENIRITSQVVKMAEDYNVHVEAELGYVAKLGQLTDQSGLTIPEEAKRFVNETGISSLAVAIGSAHGFYKSEPKLDLERLDAINKATNAFLVLHGGSGIPEDQIREAIQRGICKINVATEIKSAFMKSIRNEAVNSEEIDLRRVFLPAKSAVKDIVIDKFKIMQKPQK